MDLFWKQKFLAKKAERKFHFTVVITESTRHVITTFVLLTLSYKFTNFELLKFNVVLKWLEIVCIRMTYISFKQSCCILKYRQKIRSIWNLPIYTAARGSTVPQYNFFYPSTSLKPTPLSFTLLFYFNSKYPSRYYIFPFTSNSFHFHLSLNASGFAASKKNTICTIFWQKNVFKSEWTFLELFQRSEKKTFFRKQLAFVIEI